MYLEHYEKYRRGFEEDQFLGGVKWNDSMLCYEIEEGHSCVTKEMANLCTEKLLSWCIACDWALYNADELED